MTDSIKKMILFAIDELQKQGAFGNSEILRGRKTIARFLDCNEQTLDKHIQDDGLPVWKDSGAVITSKSMILDWLKKKTKKRR